MTPVHSVEPNAGPPPGRAVAIPDKLHIDEGPAELTITWRWFTWGVLFLVPFCIAWNAFLIGWYSLMGEMGDAPFGFRLMFYLFPLGHVAVGVGLLGLCLVLLLNRSTVRVGHGELSVHHGPIPWPGNQRLAADEIVQLYCTHRKQTDSDGDTTDWYTLHARLRSGRTVKVMPNCPLEVIRAVEHLVENRLGLVDARIPGEHRH